MSPNYLITLEPACLEGARITRQVAQLKSLMNDPEAGNNEKTEFQMELYREKSQEQATRSAELRCLRVRLPP